MTSATMLLEFLNGIVLAAAALGCLYLLIAAMLVLRFCRPEVTARTIPAEPVTILKPLHGAEPGLSHRLQRFCSQDHPAQVQVVCGVNDRADPAISIADAIRAGDPRLDLVIDERRHGSNPKVSNLINMWTYARHDIVILSDSDIEVERDYVREITAALAQQNVGAVSCLYRGVAARGLYSRLAALAINSHFLPNAILALSFRLAEPCFGATVALRRSMLRRIGGFDVFKDVLADDNAIGRAVRAAGRSVVVPRFAVGHVCDETNLQALLAQDLRVARTIRSIDPAGYAGLLITHPFALALLCAPLAGSTAVMLAGAALACRVLLGLAVKRAFKIKTYDFWLIPLRDVLSFAIFLWALFGHAVQWRGADFQIVGAGRLMPGHREA